MYCTNCGHKLEENEKFCPNCGQKVVPTEAMPMETPRTEEHPASMDAPAIASANENRADDTMVDESASETAAASSQAPATHTEEPAGSSQETTASASAGNTTEQYKHRLEEGRAASGTDAGASGGAAFAPRSDTGAGRQQTPPPVNHGPSMNGIPSEPDPNRTMKTVGLILMMIAVFFTVPQIFTTIGSFFGIFRDIFSFGYHGFLNFTYSFLNFVLNVLKLAGLLFIGGGMFLVWKKWSDQDAEPLLMTVMAGGVLLVLESLLRGILTAMFHRYFSVGSAGWGIGFAVIAIVLLVVLITQKNIDPFAGLKGDFGGGFRRDLDRVTDIARGKAGATTAGASSVAYGHGYDARTFGEQGGRPSADAGSYTSDGAGNEGAYADGNASETADASGNFNAYYHAQEQQTNQSNGPTYTGPLKTDRSLALYILFGFLTCGIYQLYIFYTIMRDINVACDGDGKHTPGLLEFIVFGILTCGIYDFYWFYSTGNRLADNAPRYGLQFQENGTAILLWMLIGSLLCFIGSYVGVYFLLNNTNAICDAYNRQR